jgi:FkbM family methyltransferase
MYKFFKYLYTTLPGKVLIFKIARKIYKPSNKIAGYLKFNGVFSVKLSKNEQLKILNDFSTIPSLIFWKGFDGYEKYSLETWIELSKNSTVTLDVGANFGLFGLVTKTVNPRSEVIFIEPLERNVNRINRNLAINQFNAKVLESAMGDKEGTITFYDMDSSENTIGSIDQDFVEKHQHSTRIIPIEVTMITIDSLVIAEELKNVDLIKIDVEGADYLTIKGSMDTLNKFNPNVLIEITDQENAQKINQLLTQLNFKYFIFEINEVKGLISCQDVLTKSNSRNYLFTVMNAEELSHAFPKLSKL